MFYTLCQQYTSNFFFPSWPGIHHIPFFFFVHYLAKLRCSSVTSNLELKRFYVYNTWLYLNRIASSFLLYNQYLPAIRKAALTLSLLAEYFFQITNKPEKILKPGMPAFCMIIAFSSITSITITITIAVAITVAITITIATKSIIE